MQTPTRIAALALAAVSLLGAAACGSDDDSPAGAEAAERETISIVGFAVPEAANKAIADEFAKTPEGEGVRFTTSYGASGEQSRSVVSGLEADYVHFSVASDVTRLVDEGLVADTWDDGPTKGIVSSSVVVFAVRPGNPKGIDTWEDLIAPGIEIVTPNPASSGAARWNALAAWGQVIAGGGSEADATAYLDAFFANVVALPGSGRDATTAFLGGTGDVLMAYENEAILAHQNGEEFDYLIPDTTMLIENPGAVLEDATPAAESWLDFVLSKEGQRQLALKGFRPVIDGVDFGEVEGANDPADPFPTVDRLLTVADDFEKLGRAVDEVLRRGGRHRDEGHRRLREGWVTATTAAPPTSSGIGRPARARRSAGAGRLTRVSGLGLGLAMLWFSLLVLLPLAAVVATATEGGWSGFWQTVTNEQTAAAIRLTVSQAALVTLVNVVMGTLIAWVLVRDDFAGKRVLEVLIDIPFALPTIVAGLVLLSLYGSDSPLGIDVANKPPAVFLAFLFVTLPFVVRMVQPVLGELDQEAEEAAASLGASRITTFRRIVLPSLAPAIAAGAALSFARGVSEYGSLVLLSGNLPFETEVTSVRILSSVENDNLPSAAAVATVLLAISLAVIVGLDVLQRRVSRRG